MTAVAVSASHDTRDIPTEHVGSIPPNYYCRGWNAKRVKYCRARAGSGTDHPGVGRCKNHGGNQVVKHGADRARYVLEFSPKLADLIRQYQADPEPLNVLHELAVARALLHDFLDRYATFAAALTAWHDTWEGRYIPISEPEKKALMDALDEYELMVRETNYEPTDHQLETFELARSAVEFLSTPQESKPRQILDVSDAMRHVDVISKVITRAETIRAQGTVSLDRIRMFLLALDRAIELEVPETAQRERLRRTIHGIRV